MTNGEEIKTYLVKFSSSSPYFFGNEKTFSYPNQKKERYGNLYYIKSELMPSQTTILGALRYALLPVKRAKWDYTEEEKKVNSAFVGETGFDESKINTDCDDMISKSFGVIQSVSPVFLLKNDDEILVPTPKDHIIYSRREDDKKEENKNYMPFQNFTSVETADGEQCYTTEYDAKDGITDSFMSLKNQSIFYASDIFSETSRVGIKRDSKEKGFFRKDYYCLKPEFCFAVYVTINVSEIEKNKQAYQSVISQNGEYSIPEKISIHMGQGMAMFAMNFKEVNENIKDNFKIEDSGTRRCRLYFLGDAFVKENYKEGMRFGVIQTKDFRAFHVSNQNTVSKGSTLYHLVKAGSVLYVDNIEEWISKNKNPYVEQVGFNYYVKIGEK